MVLRQVLGISVSRELSAGEKCDCCSDAVTVWGLITDEGVGLVGASVAR